MVLRVWANPSRASESNRETQCQVVLNRGEFAARKDGYERNAPTASGMTAAVPSPTIVKLMVYMFTRPADGRGPVNQLVSL